MKFDFPNEWMIPDTWYYWYLIFTETRYFWDPIFLWPDISDTRYFWDPIFLRPDISETQYFCDTIFLWLYISVTPYFCDSIFLWPDIFETQYFWDLYFWDPIYLRVHISETQFFWDPIFLRPDISETQYFWCPIFLTLLGYFSLFRTISELFVTFLMDMFGLLFWKHKIYSRSQSFEHFFLLFEIQILHRSLYGLPAVIPAKKLVTPLKNEGLPKNPGRPIDFTIIKNKRRNFTIFGLLNIL